MSVGIDTKSFTITDTKWIERLVAAVFVMSVIDGIMTLYWVLMRVAEEANPLMDYLLTLHPALFMAVKIGLVSLGTTLLWRYRFRPFAMVGTGLCFMVYAAILVAHFGAAVTLIQRAAFLSS